ncbi:MAG: hypothetical protein IPK17_28010 [Chloroflexi bacterium]|uniref:hypothetical protein n=1 Tax=Candidatus Flexifilum breve TaxID=3140694 RepID=UPI0031359985|nr:hypothetical protein [Chloroflexota bacterium]
MEDQTASAPGIAALQPRRPRRRENPYAKSVRHFLRNRFALVAVAVIALIVVVCAAAPLLDHQRSGGAGCAESPAAAVRAESDGHG